MRTTDAHVPRTCDPQQDKPPQWKSLALQLESSLLSPEKLGMLWSMGSPRVRQDWAGTHVLINQYELVATFSPYYVCNRSSLIAQLVKNPPASRRPQLDSWIGKVCYRRDKLPTPEFICNAETWVQFLGWEDPLEKGKATHSSILAWRIPWTLQSMGSQRVGNDWATFTFTSLPCLQHWSLNGLMILVLKGLDQPLHGHGAV